MSRILVVDDNELNRDMLSRRLIKRGYEVALANDGHSAVTIARDTQPELILLDMGLPIMSGWDAARALKADPATSSIYVIALTAHSMPGDRERALSSGCDDFDTKPIDLQRLLEKVEALLGR